MSEDMPTTRMVIVIDWRTDKWRGKDAWIDEVNQYVTVGQMMGLNQGRSSLEAKWCMDETDGDEVA